MGTEVDSIELQIETSAKQANRSLTGMQNRLKKIASTLSEIGSLAPKLNNIGGVDISGLKSSQKYLDGIVNKQKKLGSATTKLKVDTSEIKKADQGFSALMRKYKDSTFKLLTKSKKLHFLQISIFFISGFKIFLPGYIKFTLPTFHVLDNIATLLDN